MCDVIRLTGISFMNRDIFMMPVLLSTRQKFLSSDHYQKGFSLLVGAKADMLARLFMFAGVTVWAFIYDTPDVLAN